VFCFVGFVLLWGWGVGVFWLFLCVFGLVFVFVGVVGVVGVGLGVGLLVVGGELVGLVLALVVVRMLLVLGRGVVWERWVHGLVLAGGLAAYCLGEFLIAGP
ncbi:hypothetical protein, partial [Pseudomonas syringae group genomosp. 7]|uniref:hypothetical protein n=1 Tax=Pseudomonas syringae group genomosp. 7 TaxID=251699 RepID=UPI00376FACCC